MEDRFQELHLLALNAKIHAAGPENLNAHMRARDCIVTQPKKLVQVYMDDVQVLLSFSIYSDETTIEKGCKAYMKFIGLTDKDILYNAVLATFQNRQKHTREFDIGEDGTDDCKRKCAEELPRQDIFTHTFHCPGKKITVGAILGTQAEELITEVDQKYIAMRVECSDIKMHVMKESFGFKGGIPTTRDLSFGENLRYASQVGSDLLLQTIAFHLRNMRAVGSVYPASHIVHRLWNN